MNHPITLTAKSLISWAGITITLVSALISGASYFFVHMSEIEATTNNQKIIYNKLDILQKDMDTLGRELGYVKGQVDSMSQKDQRRK